MSGVRRRERGAQRPSGPVAAADALVEGGAIRALASRPDLWPTAVRLGLASLQRGWWRRPWRRPVVPDAYLAWRHQTMWGDQPDARLSGPQMVAYLDWVRRMGGMREAAGRAVESPAVPRRAR